MYVRVTTSAEPNLWRRCTVRHYAAGCAGAYVELFGNGIAGGGTCRVIAFVVAGVEPGAAPAAAAAATTTTTTTTTTITTITPFYLLKAALLVNLYQDEPILNQAFRFLQKLMDIDELMTQWRHRHALMVRHL